MPNDHPHLLTLKDRHRALDAQIADLERRPGSDDLEITKLKREKLRLKEEIVSFA